MELLLIIDFGLAKRIILNYNENINNCLAEVVGTLSYMSPEIYESYIISKSEKLKENKSI